MYTIRINLQNNIELYLHEDCDFDIHRVSQDFIRNFDEGNGGEYIVRDDNHSTIAFF